METAKLILDYLKALVWPFVVICAVFIFSAEIRALAGRITGGTASLGPASVAFQTGKTKDDGPSGAPAHPDIWFEIFPVSFGHEECLKKAQTALERTRFLNGGLKPGGLAYGYNDKFVGAVWCGRAKDNLILITAAGPLAEGLQARYADLAKAFFGSLP